MADSRKLPSGKWQVRWREPGGRRAKSVSTIRTRDKLLAAVVKCEELGVSYRPEPEAAAPPAITDGMSAFILDLKRSRKPKTVANYDYAVDAFSDFLDAVYADVVSVDELSRDMLARFYDWLLLGRHKHARSLDTKKRIVEKIEAAWQWLFDTEWSPLVPRPRTIEMSRDAEKTVHAPSFVEMAACVNACVSEGPRRLATILYFTGLRTSQALTLEWDAVDVERGVMTVAPHKGGAGRVIPLSRHFLAVLATWGVREGRVCGWSVGHTLAERRLNEAWKRAGVRAEAWERAPGKAFRRGVTTGLRVLGADKELAELYVGRDVEGARARYLDLGAVPFEPVARLIPKMEARSA